MQSSLAEVGRRPFLQAKTPDELLSSMLATDRTLTIVLSGFAGIAALIAVTGIVGLLGYVLQLRRKEIGIRLALGATRSSIQAQFLKYAISLALPGLLLGALLSYALRQSILNFLFQARASDPWVWAVSASFLLGASLLAAAVPARRAASVDPQMVLRAD
ncbi:MAG: FtsX-like permease family protein [Acidobacteria bacterium]|nr:FtsX-like permease family protein [Acidobacteriota bacterium]